jgi:hypothetical protein
VISPPRSVVRLIQSLLLIAAITACGGGGKGSAPPGASITGTGSAPGTGPGDAQLYFPLAAGDIWFYEATNDDSAAPTAVGELTSTVNGTKTVQGVVATVLTHANTTVSGGPVDGYYTSAGGGVTYWGNSNPMDTLTPLIVPYVQLLFPVQTGTVSSIVGKNLAFGKDAAGNPKTLDLTQTIVNAGFESVSAAAGNFPNALKQVTSVTGTTKDAGQSVAVSGTDTAWLVPGIGVVKEATTAGVPGNSVTQSVDLKGYTVNGKHGGFGKPFNVSAVTNPMASLAPAIASDGTNFLVPTLDNYGSGATSFQAWNARLLGPDGTILITFGFVPSNSPGSFGPTPRAVAAFDGSHYLVVFTDTFPAGSQTEELLAVLLPTSQVASNAPVVIGPLAIASETAGVKSLALGFDGSKYLLVFLQSLSATESRLSGVFLSAATGDAIGAPFTIAPPGGTQANPTIAFDGTNYLVAWEGTGGINATRVSTTGVPLDVVPPGLILASNGSQSGAIVGSPTLAFDGTNFLLAYTDARAQGAGGLNYAVISASRISSGGVLLEGSPDSPGIAVTSAPGVVVGRPTAAFLGGQYWLAWEHGGMLYGTRISTAGSVSSPGADGFALIPTTTNTHPVLGASAQGGMLTWINQGATGTGPLVIGQTIYPIAP